MSTDDGMPQHESDKREIEQARARLLAQLGDRLVQDQYQPVNDQAPDEDQAAPNIVQRPGEHELKSSNVSTPSHGALLAAATISDELPANIVPTHVTDMNTIVTVDMILTVAAECFGQRDLLKYRRQW
jgi:hypothetical protein